MVIRRKPHKKWKQLQSQPHLSTLKSWKRNPILKYKLLFRVLNNIYLYKFFSTILFTLLNFLRFFLDKAFSPIAYYVILNGKSSWVDGSSPRKNYDFFFFLPFFFFFLSFLALAPTIYDNKNVIKPLVSPKLAHTCINLKPQKRIN